MVEENLKREIKALEKQLTDKKCELFNHRLSYLVGFSLEEIYERGVSDIKFEISEDAWNISYTHVTDQYDENNYINSSDSEVETTPAYRKSYMNFGKGKRYYIKGNNSNRFRIYKNSKKELRVINTDYDTELDLEEQEELITRYSINKHMPEWFAIKVFMFISENEWSDENICSYLSLI